MVAQVIVPEALKPKPSPEELSAASILAEHFNQPVTFLIPIDSYKRKTPDVLLGGVQWEIKTPRSSSKRALNTLLQKASKQSPYVVIDSRFTKLDDPVILKILRREAPLRSRLRTALLINKRGAIVDLYRKNRHLISKGV